MNDPCAPGYNAKTGLYHVSFQWNPYGNDWGNISWCSATSPDMANWTVDSKPSLSPDQPYDCEAVFTGCMIHGSDGSINYLYTSTSSLPIHYTLPYAKGCESLSLASSYDNGQTWKKSPHNPILPNAPEGYDTTGWRDPYIARWPRMSAVLGLDNEETLVGVISGGIRNVTPTTFLYIVDADDLTKWEFVGPIVEVGLNCKVDPWYGDLGRNWEVTNFVCGLKDEVDPNVERDFLIMGTEGRNSDVLEDPTKSSDSFRPYRNQLWMSVSPQKGPNGVKVSNDFDGVLDYGCMYAANSFYDPVSKRQVVWGWITEDDLGDQLRQPQGWSGMLSLPRELRMQTTQNVVDTCGSKLTSISSIELELDDFGSYTVRTLGSQPCTSVVEALRRSPSVRRRDLSTAYLGPDTRIGFAADDVQSLQWELDCSFQLSKSCCRVGVRIDDAEGSTATLAFDPQAETFEIQRPAFLEPACSDLINNRPESAPHTLFATRNPTTGTKTTENLHIQAWRDNSVLEVFVNGRTAISTRLYALGATRCMSFFSDELGSNKATLHDSCISTELINATLWNDIGVASSR